MSPKSEHEEILAPAHGSEAPGAAEKTLGRVAFEAGVSFGRHKALCIGANPSPVDAERLIVDSYEAMAQAVVEEHERRKAAVTQALDVRPDVRAFAQLMEADLDTNDYQRDWEIEQTSELIDRASEAVSDLRALRAAYKEEGAADGERELQHIVHEAVTLANFAMMIADVSGGLPTLACDLAAKAGGT